MLNTLGSARMVTKVTNIMLILKKMMINALFLLTWTSPDSTWTPPGLHLDFWSPGARTWLEPEHYKDFTRILQGVQVCYKDNTGSPPERVAQCKVLFLFKN